MGDTTDTPVALAQWIGRTQTITDPISAVPARQMAAALDDAARMRDPAGSPLPAGWHWLYFNPMEVQSRLGEDGHPARGDFLPPVALPRRMWAGSRLFWTRAFTVCTAVDKTSEIIKVSRKSGRSGEMLFVTVAHTYADVQGPLLREEHDIVYRESASDAVMLFRYSAATFNGHRMHYDLDYCRHVESYPGLVVHGPLIATLLLGYVEKDIAPQRGIRSFEFQATRPTFDLGGFHLHASVQDGDADTLRVWATNHLGEVGIYGVITLAPTT